MSLPRNESLFSMAQWPTSLSSSSIRVTIPDMGSTQKYSLDPELNPRPYLTGCPSGSVPFKTYTCVPKIWETGSVLISK